MVIYYWRNRIVAIAPVLKTGTQQWVRGFESHFLRHALVVQRIEHRFSKPRIEVRFLSRAHLRIFNFQFTIWRLWCNGNTTLCGSVITGSNPVSRPDKK